MVCAGARDDGVPDDRLIRGIGVRGPLSRDIDEQLFRVPCEERGQVRFEREFDDGVLFLLRAVVVRPAADDLDVLGCDDAARRPWSEEIGSRNESSQDEGDSREESEHGLDSCEGAMHGGRCLVLGVHRSLAGWAVFILRIEFSVASGLVLWLAFLELRSPEHQERFVSRMIWQGGFEGARATGRDTFRRQDV